MSILRNNVPLCPPSVLIYIYQKVMKIRRKHGAKSVMSSVFFFFLNYLNVFFFGVFSFRALLKKNSLIPNELILIPYKHALTHRESTPDLINHKKLQQRSCLLKKYLAQTAALWKNIYYAQLHNNMMAIIKNYHQSTVCVSIAWCAGCW